MPIPKLNFPIITCILSVFISSPGAVPPKDCSGLKYAGTFHLAQDPNNTGPMEKEMSHKLTLAKFYVMDRYTWHNMIEDLAYLDKWKGVSGKKLISVPMLPAQNENRPNPAGDAQNNFHPYSRQELDSMIAAGGKHQFDAKWTRFAQQIKEKFGNEELYLRLGWEFNLWNGNSDLPTSNGLFAWAPNEKTKADWIKYWIAIEGIFNVHIPNAKMVWCLGFDANDGTDMDQNKIPDESFYPGDQHVDIIGIDLFDRYPSLISKSLDPWAIWDSQIYKGMHGLKFWSDFARSHGKPLSFPEWGLVDQSESSGSYGNDDPYFITKMYEYMSNPQNNVLFHVYTGHYHGANSMPNGMNEYRETFSRHHNYCDLISASRILLLKGSTNW